MTQPASSAEPPRRHPLTRHIHTCTTPAAVGCSSKLLLLSQHTRSWEPLRPCRHALTISFNGCWVYSAPKAGHHTDTVTLRRPEWCCHQQNPSNTQNVTSLLEISTCQSRFVCQAAGPQNRHTVLVSQLTARLGTQGKSLATHTTNKSNPQHPDCMDSAESPSNWQHSRINQLSQGMPSGCVNHTHCSKEAARSILPGITQGLSRAACISSDNHSISTAATLF